MSEDMEDVVMIEINFVEWLNLKTQRDELYGALISIIVDHEIALAKGEPSGLSQSDYDKAEAALYLAQGRTEMPSLLVRKTMRRYWKQEQESRASESPTTEKLRKAL